MIFFFNGEKLGEYIKYNERPSLIDAFNITITAHNFIVFLFIKNIE